MKARSGQVALYLVAALAALAFLFLADWSAFLAVRAKNRAMNAGDAAALAVARLQGELLNEIGRLNLEHLEKALEDDAEACRDIVARQARLSFLGPLDGIAAGNAAARENGARDNDEMLEVLRQHVIDIRRDYASNPDLYPEPWEGAWNEYATALEIALGSGLCAGPDNIDFLDAESGHILLRRAFYEAVAGQNWCWFHFNAMSLLESYGGVGSWPPLPSAGDDARRRKCVNSEVYSLGLRMRTGSALDLLGADLIRELAHCTDSDIASSHIITNTLENWFFFDANTGSSGWSRWRELDSDGLSPYVGEVRPEYDVKGCSAVCRVIGTLPRILSQETCDTVWTAAAKPFGTVTDLDGATQPVTAFGNFVTPAFSDVRLVAIDAVGGADLATSDPDWARHVREHLARYLARGTAACAPACWYCQQLQTWERESVRATARTWLRWNAGNCTIGGSGSDSRGASPPH